MYTKIQFMASRYEEIFYNFHVLVNYLPFIGAADLIHSAQQSYRPRDKKSLHAMCGYSAAFHNDEHI